MVTFISLFLHHDCFLQSHLFLSSFPSCHQSASFVYPSCFFFFLSGLRRAIDGLLFGWFSFLMHVQTTGVCIFESYRCLPDRALYYYEDICHLGSSERLSPCGSLLTFYILQTAACQLTWYSCLFSCRIL